MSDANSISPPNSSIATSSQNWKLSLAYDGTDFNGWQVQPGMPTIQGELSAALYRISGERVLPQGSGRTDAGVHAEAQIATFPLAAPLPAANLRRALNRTLPDSIRVLEAQPVAPDFHARHSAIAKTYKYRILLCPEEIAVCPPSLARFWLPISRELNIKAMQQATAEVIGQHDFATFAASDPDLTQRNHPELPLNTTRTIFQSEWQHHDAQLVYTIRGNGFLHHMVRNLVGTFLDIGYGRFAPDSLPRILAAADRTAAGPTAPARGLTLISVEY
jgi:tRNA pseudouridine38-40 synthase